MLGLDPRLGIHNVTVQQLPPSGRRPYKRLSHVVKTNPSGRSSGVLTPLKARTAIRIGRGLE